MKMAGFCHTCFASCSRRRRKPADWFPVRFPPIFKTPPGCPPPCELNKYCLERAADLV